MAPTSKVKVIKVLVKDLASDPTKKIANQMANLNKQVGRVGNSMKTTNGILLRAKSMMMGLVAAMGAREILRSADAFQLVKDRIRALWGEGVDAEATLRKVHQVAKDTNAPLETLADGFARISLSAKGMGLSVDETARGVKSLQQTLRLSGASVAEVNSVYLQFSQAMGLSRLQGQELRAVMLGNAKLAGMLAKEFKTTRGALRDLGEKGLLDTARIFRMLIREGVNLDEQASKLKVTFGQAMIKAFDAFRVQIDKLNTAIGGSQGFAKAVDLMTNNMDLMAGVVAGIVSGGLFYAVAYGIDAMTTAMVRASATAFFAFLISPAGLIAAGAAIVGAIAAVTTFIQMQEKAATKTVDHLLKEERLTVQLEIAERNLVNRKAMLEKMNKKSENYRIEKNKLVVNRLMVNSLTRQLGLRKKLNKKLLEGQKEEKKKDPLLGMQKLNATLDERNRLTKKYVELSRYMATEELGKKLDTHKISGEDYNNQLKKINEEHDKLLRAMADIKNKDNVFYGIQMGAEATFKSIGTLATEISKVTTQAFSHLEDNLVEFTKTGKFEFAKFAQSIMDDITRMVIRMSIIKPLAGALSGAISGPRTLGLSQGDTTTADFEAGGGFAKGGAFNRGNVIPFATGGIVSGPTTFGMSGGRTGLMGESGAEAILPLSRGSNGKLGVSGSGAIVNIYNQGGGEAETKRSTNSDGQEQIDVYIKQKVNEGFSEGRYDKPMQQLYGVSRKGA